jgi:hypothetical protein
VSRDDENGYSRPSPVHDDEASPRPVSDRRLALFFVALAAALVLGYLLLSKLADMSQEEDCALAHRKTCGASEMSSPARLAAGDAVQLGGRQPPGGV